VNNTTVVEQLQRDDPALEEGQQGLRPLQRAQDQGAALARSSAGHGQLPRRARCSGPYASLRVHQKIRGHWRTSTRLFKLC
jgi:hypothetical protein